MKELTEKSRKTSQAEDRSKENQQNTVQNAAQLRDTQVRIT